MTRFSKMILMTGVAVLALSACSSGKGPGAIGKKEDIVVRNKGIPGQENAETAKAGDFSSTVEQAEAIPSPAVEEGQPLPDTSPEVAAAEQQVADASAPVPSTTNTPTNDLSPATAPEPSSQETPVGVVTPDQPVTESVAPPAVNEPAPSTEYPQSASVATQPAPAPVATTAPSHAYTPAPAGYQPADPNAPYSPKAAAAAGATATTAHAATTPAAGLNLTDPVLIRSAQAALKAKGGYAGAETGQVDATFLNALAVYQGANGLPMGGLNEATLRHLGVIE